MRLAQVVFSLALLGGWSIAKAEAQPAAAPDHEPGLLAPRPLQAEIGLLLGALFVSPRHNFHDEQRTHSRLNPAAMMVGARAAFLPIPWLGIETDGLIAPSATEDGRGATAWALRGHLLGQLPRGRWTAFLLTGAGRMGVKSDVVGNDADPVLELGAGLKYAVGSIVSARLDVRDGLTQKNGAELGRLTHHVELTAGFSYLLPGARSRRKPSAARGDQRPRTAEERCRDAAAGATAACPAGDPDGDGVPTARDRCPATRGAASDGCPADRDGDGVIDAADQCPDMRGGGRDGCAPDADSDGIPDERDRCPVEPEKTNGHADDDGCPDPPRVRELTGVEFEPARDGLRLESRAVLDELALALHDSSVRWRITVEVGELKERTANMALAQGRLESLVKYLETKGVDRKWLDTVGTALEPHEAATAPTGTRIRVEELSQDTR